MEGQYMKKSSIVFMFVLVGILLCGCMDTSNTQPQSGLYSELKALPESGELKENVMDYSSMSEEEYNARVVLNAGDMYGDLLDYRYKDKISYGEYEIKYGIEDYFQVDCMYGFNTLEDMETVFTNPDFLSDYQKTYGFKLNIDSYYMLPASLRTQYENEVLVITLVVIDGGHNFYLSGGNFTGTDTIIWRVLHVEDRVTLNTVAEFYAQKDNLQLQHASLEDGRTVYYMSSDKGCTLFEDMDVSTSNMTTAYLWEQDGVTGVLIVQGEHKDENLGMCILEKHEI
jgi:hypothetical protein